MARGGQYQSGPYPVGRPYNEDYYKGGPPQGFPSPQYKDRLTQSSYPEKSNGSLVQGGRVGTLKFLAGAQLIVGVLLEILGVVHVALGPLNMSLALVTGLCVLWCPLGSIATGITGLFLSRGNTRDFVCVRRGYQVMCLLNAFFFMVLLALTTGFVQLRYFDKDPSNITANEKLLIAFLSMFMQAGVSGGLQMEKTEEGDLTGYMSLAAAIITLSCLEFLFAVIALAIICCGAPFAIDQGEPMTVVQSGPPPMIREEVMMRPEPVRELAYYPEPEPIYIPRPKPQSELALAPYSKPRPSYRSYEREPKYKVVDEGYDQDYLKQYYQDYYKDYEQMMDKFKEARRERGTIDSADFARHVGPSRRERPTSRRSFDDINVTYGRRTRPVYSDVY